MRQASLTITTSTCWTGEAPMCCRLHWATQYTFGTPQLARQRSSLPLMRMMALSRVLAGLLMADTLLLASTPQLSSSGIPALTDCGEHCKVCMSRELVHWHGTNILTVGDMDGKIVNNDMRIRSHAVQTYHGHEQEVCGLKWSGSGKKLASGGNDHLLHIWDVSMASSAQSTGRSQWLHRLDDHLAAVKALAWCPFQSNLLASGGGVNDRCIKFWNTHTGACLSSVDTGSQVCARLWNKNDRELLSSHGFTQNQLTLWKYPSMVKMAELNGHTSPVLFMAQSPDGCTVASAADETLGSGMFSGILTLRTLQ